MSVDQAAAEVALSSPPRRGETRILGPLAVGLALLSAFATFIVLADLTPIAPTHYVVVSLLLANAATVILLLTIIVREVWQVVHARRTGRAAARLHVRIEARVGPEVMAVRGEVDALGISVEETTEVRLVAHACKVSLIA